MAGTSIASADFSSSWLKLVFILDSCRSVEERGDSIISVFASKNILFELS
jgi:hypothetical protein